jgi:hypothetical protein
MQLAAVAAGMGFWTRDLETDLETDIEDWDEQMLELYGVTCC